MAPTCFGEPRRQSSTGLPATCAPSRLFLAIARSRIRYAISGSTWKTRCPRGEYRTLNNRLGTKRSFIDQTATVGFRRRRTFGSLPASRSRMNDLGRKHTAGAVLRVNEADGSNDPNKSGRIVFRLHQSEGFANSASNTLPVKAPAEGEACWSHYSSMSQADCHR